MAFHFVFEKMLRLRAGVEHQEEKKLAVIAGEIAKIRAEMADCAQRRNEIRRAALQGVAGGSSGAELQFAVVCDEAAAELDRKLKVRLRAAEKAQARQLEVYRQARQKREVFERLRDRRFGAYESEAARREQESIDENFLIRRGGEDKD
jgi:flagellar FliJ protein